MTTTESHWRPGNPWAAACASLIPWAAFLVAAAAADLWVHHEVSATGLAAAAPLYLGFVALPAMVPLVVARTGATRAGVLIVMTAVATISAVLVVTTDDAQAGLAVLWVPFVAIPLATVVWIGQAVAARRNRTPDPAPFSLAGTSDRLAALVIDVAVLGTALVFPLTAMSHANREVAAGVAGVAVGTLYMAALIATRRQTIGQSLLGLAVVDDATLERLKPARAAIRSIIVVIEVAAIPTIILSLPAVAEFVSVLASGRSITDRLLGTSVVTDSRPR